MKALVPMFGATVTFAVLDSTAKLVSYHVPILEMAWFRYLINFILAAIVLNPWRTPEAWRFARPGLQVMRALLLTGMTVANFGALHYLQLAETTAIGFLSPLLITALSVLFLKEKIGPRRLIAILVGFSGVLLITRPGLGDFHPAMLLAIAGMASGAVYYLVTRQLATRVDPGSLVLSLAAVPSVVLLPVLPFIWVTPEGPLVWSLLLLIGVTGGFGHFLVMTAHRHASAAALAPYGYLQLVWMVISGYMLFSDIPSIFTLAGAGIVIASGLYLLHREQVVAAREQAAATGAD